MAVVTPKSEPLSTNTILELATGYLRELQGRVIGIFFPRMYPHNEYIVVINNEDGVLTCVGVGSLLGVSTLHIEANQGRYVPFPDGKTLAQMMEQPTAFNDWMIKQFED